MPLICLLPSTDWDFPIFKVLANNDTGAAAGHQGGVVIPKDLRGFFPGLAGTASSGNPTLDSRIKAELFIENEYKARVSTRYQFQTWGAKRSPESRLTDPLGPLRNAARGGDILLIQRSMDHLDLFRLTLARQTSAEFAELSPIVGGRTWGVLYENTPPVSDDDLNAARTDEKVSEGSLFQLFDPAALYTTSTATKVARSIAFRESVLGLYNRTCALCGEGLKSPSGLIESEAAHVVPRSMRGTDDARNGLALCKSHHWAFDRGLFGVGDDRAIVVPRSVGALPQNARLQGMAGAPIKEASQPELAVHPAAFKWHRDNILLAK